MSYLVDIIWSWERLVFQTNIYIYTYIIVLTRACGLLYQTLGNLKSIFSFELIGDPFVFDMFECFGGIQCHYEANLKTTTLFN